MKRLLLIAAICVIAAPAMASDTFPITGTQGTLLHNATTGEITELDPLQTRALGRPLWRFVDTYAFGSMDDNELPLDCADVENNVAVQSIGFTAYNNCDADCALFIPLYTDENNDASLDPPVNIRNIIGGFYIENIPGSALTHPPDEYWGYNWVSTLIAEPFTMNGADLDADGLQDFGYGFWYLTQPNGIIGPGLVGEPNVALPDTAPGAENGFDLFLDPNFQFDPNLLGNAPATTTFVGYMWYGATNFAQFYFEMYAPGCPNAGDAGRFCSADIYGFDCMVNLNDLAQLLGNYGMTTGASVSDGDVDPYDEFFPGDGDVDLGDLAELLGQYGNDCNL